MTKEEEIKVLEGTKEIIKKGWCQGAAARDARGRSVNSSSAIACTWCLTGAIEKSLQENFKLSWYNGKDSILPKISSLLPPERSEPVIRSDQFDVVVDFNDNHATTKEDVLNILSKVIEGMKK